MHRLAEVAAFEGAVLRDAAFDRTGFAGDGGGRVLCCAAAARFLRRALAQPETAAVVVPPDLAAEVPEGIGALVAEDAEMAFWRLHNRLAREFGLRVAVEPFVDPSAESHPEALVSADVRLGPSQAISSEIELGAVVGISVPAGERQSGFFA